MRIRRTVPSFRIARPFAAPRLAVLSSLALIAAACQSAPKTAPGIVMAAGTGVVGANSAAAISAAQKSAAAFAPADVEFMQGMIPHHAQAVIMARWAATHGARADIQRLSERIAVAQSDEIRLMRRWLAERKQEVPDSMATRHIMKMGNMTHEELMPGMLTDEQMRALDAARGPAFDRLFLVGMIGHHEGAIGMVRKLFGVGEAGHDETVFRFATDVETDQSTELHKMQLMLATVPE